MLMYASSLIGAYCIVRWLCENIFSPLLDVFREWKARGRKTLPERYGEWAVIIGTTDVIWEGYALHLAEQGMNLMLISNAHFEHIAIAEQIQNSFGVEVRYILGNFLQENEVNPDILDELAKIDIGILVINVGFIPSDLEDFDDGEVLLYNRMVENNIISVIHLTYLVLPQMKLARRGLIIYISSYGVLFPFPYQAMFSATKAFGHNLMLALQQELHGSGVECRVMVPKHMSPNRNEPWKVTLVGGSLNAYGNEFSRNVAWMTGKATSIPKHLRYTLMSLAENLFPHALSMYIIRKFFKYAKDQQNFPNMQQELWQ